MSNIEQIQGITDYKVLIIIYLYLLNKKFAIEKKIKKNFFDKLYFLKVIY